MKQILLILFLSLSFQAFAGVISERAVHFKTTGSIQSFKWAPARYNSEFRYDIIYYIPETLKDSESAKTLIFMHGGGASTMDRDGSIRTVNVYMRDMVKLANETQTVVVMPSANGLNWGGHTFGMIRDLNHLMRQELNVDHNNMGLGGHSMGGMGIGRSYQYLADEFAYFLPTAAGIDPKNQTEANITKFFNTPYVHLQGLHDHLKDFVVWCRELEVRNAEIEKKFGEKSKLEVIYYDGPHNYDYKLLKDTLTRLQSNPRNLYQTKLFGTLYYNDNFYTENNITFHQGSNSRYFWVEMIEASGPDRERIDFQAEAKDNIIKLDLLSVPKVIKKVRLHLSKKIFSSDRPIEIMLNNKLVATTLLNELPQTRGLDQGYVFEDYIDIDL